MTPLSITFTVRRDIATCEACKATFKPKSNGQFEVSPHLRNSHGFTEADINFKVTAEVICPPFMEMVASQGSEA